MFAWCGKPSGKGLGEAHRLHIGGCADASPHKCPHPSSARTLDSFGPHHRAHQPGTVIAHRRHHECSCALP